MSGSRLSDRFDLFELLDTLSRPAPSAQGVAEPCSTRREPASPEENAGQSSSSSEPAMPGAGSLGTASLPGALEPAELPRLSSDDRRSILNAALAGQGEGRVFRVKLGYNPNSSSLGTSVVVLLWGIGLAGVLFQLVGAWVLAAQRESRTLPPSEGEE